MNDWCSLPVSVSARHECDAESEAAGCALAFIESELGCREFESIMARWAWLVISSAFAVPPVSAEIFKCADSNGMDRYQNFPCAIDSIGSLPSGPAFASTPSPPNRASQVQPTVMPVAFAAMSRSTDASEPRIGMTAGEVTAIWGEPMEVDQDEPKQGRIEIWRYGDGRSVQFSNKHRVSAVQR